MQQDTFQYSNGDSFTATTTDDGTPIRRDQDFTNDEALKRDYSVVAADFLTIIEYARRHGLRLKGDPTRALAFFLTTRGIGNLWFESAQ